VNRRERGPSDSEVRSDERGDHAAAPVALANWGLPTDAETDGAAESVSLMLISSWF
jgi:hypothetical protein